MKKLFYSWFVLAMTALAFASCEDVPMPYNYPSSGESKTEEAVDPAGSGTVDEPYNVAAANQLIASGDEDALAEKVYVKGIIVSIKEIDTSNYGNATYYISDTGTSTDQLTVYRGYSLGNVKFTSEDEIQEGDTVVVYGTLVNYNGTYEFTQGNYIYSINGKTAGGSESTAEADGSGTLDDPYNVAAAQELIATLDDDVKSDYVYVKGIIVAAPDISTSYGNATYYISDDGTTAGQLYIYRGYYLDNVKFTSGDEIKAGDEVVVYGQLIDFKGNTPEMTQGNYIVELNGSGSGSEESGDEWKKVSSIASGEYVIAANTDGSAYVCATPLTGNYGYLKTADATLSGDVLSGVESANVFTFTAVSGGYTIQDASGYYYYMTGTYNSFNRSESLPDDGYVWTVSFNSDGTVNIVNNSMSKTLQYSSKYTSYGAYSSVSNTLPCLFSKNGSSGSESSTTSKSWKLATSVSAGKIIIAANTDGSAYVCATPLTGNYGYLKTADATLSGETLTGVEESNAFTIAAVSGGYTIQDASGYYYYMTGTYNSFNRSTSLPDDGYVWSITINSDGTASIVNNSTSKTLQYSSKYTSYGAYSTVSNTLPCIFIQQ